MIRIESVKAREILDSRGNPTVEVKVTTEVGGVGVVKVPSGASKGKREALELRNGGKRYLGKGVREAVRNVNEKIAPEVVKLNVLDQEGVDRLLLELDGTPNKTKLGANAILGVSLGVCCAAADSLGVPVYRYIGGMMARLLPIPLINVINGGAHAGWNLDIQEYMIIPVDFSSFSDAIRASSEIFHTLKSELSKNGLSVAVGDEGGFAPSLRSNREPLELLMKAIEKAGYRAGKEVFLGLDLASSSFFENGKYNLRKDKKSLDTAGMIEFIKKLLEEFPIVSVEDALAEDDEEGWIELTKSMKELEARKKLKIQIVGDDVFVTNPEVFAKGIERGIANAILVKPNQVGTLSETLKVVEMAKSAGYNVVISHRSGETEDTFIADLVVGVGAGQIKTGSLSRSERIAKYNRLLEIEQELGSRAIYSRKYGKE